MPPSSYFETIEDKDSFISFCVSSSSIETEIVPTNEDEILTLSTCTGRGYDTRWVVQAVQTGYFEA